MTRTTRWPMSSVAMALTLSIGVGLATYLLARGPVSMLAELGDQYLLRVAAYRLYCYACGGSLALFYFIVPSLLRAAPKHVAVLPIDQRSWLLPQLRQAHQFGAAVCAGLLGGLSLAMLTATSMHATGLILIFSSLLIAGLLVSYGALRSVSLRWQRQYQLSFGIACMWSLLTAFSHWPRIQQAFLQLDISAIGLPNCLISFTVISSALLFVHLLKRADSRWVARPLPYAAPQLGRLANSARWRGPLLSRATLRGLLADRQAASFTAGIIIITIAGLLAARRLHNPIFSGLILSNAATMIPIGLASWLMNARGYLGIRRYSLVHLPIPPAQIVGQQMFVALLLAGGLQLASLWLGCWLVTIPVLADEWIRLIDTGLVIACIGYASGQAIMPRKDEQLTIISSLLLCLSLAAIYAAVARRLHAHGLILETLIHGMALSLCALLSIWFEWRRHRSLQS